MAARNAELILRLVDNVTAPARAVSATLGRLNTALSGTATAWRRSAADMTGLAAPIAIGGAALGRDVLQFEKAWVDLGAVIEASDAQLARIRGQADDFGDIGIGQTAYLQAATEFAKAGFGADVLDAITPAGLALAKAGDVTTEAASGVVTSTLASFGIQKDFANEAMKVADQVAYAADKSIASVEDLTLSMTYLAPVGGALNVELEALTAAQIALANSGIKGERAGTGLRAVMLSIVDPTTAAQKALDAMGVSLDRYVQTGQRIEAKPLLDLLADQGFDARGSGIETALQGHLDNTRYRADPALMQEMVSSLILAGISEPMDSSDRAAFAEALGEQLGLLSSDIDLIGLFEEFGTIPGAEAYFGAIFGREATAAAIALSKGNLRAGVDDVLDDSSGYALDVARKRTSGITGLLAQLEAAVERFAIVLSDSGLLGDATVGMQGAIDGLARLGEVNPEILRLGGAAAFAVAGLAPMGWALSGIAGTVGFLLNPITLIGGALAGIAYLNWDGIITFLQSAGEAFKAGLSPEVLTTAADALQALQNAASGIGAGIDWAGWGGAAGDAAAALANAVPQIVERLGELGAKVEPILASTKPLLESVGTALTSIVSAASRFTTGMAQGAIAFVDSFATHLDPATVDRLVAFGQSIAGLMTAIADNIVAPERLDKLLASLRGFGQLTADGLDWIVEQLGNLVAYVQSFEGLDTFAIGEKLMGDFVDGILSKMNPLHGTIQTLERLQYAFTNGSSGASWEMQNRPAGESNYNDPSGLPVPRADYGPVPVVPHAKGGAYSPGMILTGEKGPELQMASGHGQIFTARETRDMLSGKSQAQGGDTHYWNVTGSNADEIVQKITSILDRKMQRSRGLAMEDRFVTE